MFRAVQRSCVVLVGAAIAALLGAAPALADGPCGHDFDGPTACPITTSETVAGSLTATFETDYYVFYAQKRTALTLTINDTEDPTCGSSYLCSDVLVKLYDRRGNFIQVSNESKPLNGVPDPVVLTHRLRVAGIYYAVVTGVVSSPGPIPYSLTVAGSPNVQYPPPCTVPRLRRDTSLARARGVLALHHCSVGKVIGARDGRVRIGDVVGLRPRAGTVAPSGAPIAIIVSSRPKPSVHHRHRGKARAHRRRGRR